jgi:protocatechuate 3,4-dioxygenase beta subunit
MDNDDAPIGSLLSRREALSLLGAVGLSTAGGNLLYTEAALALGRTPPACIARPRQTEGPYFTDVKLNRTDIRSDPDKKVTSDGARLDLTLDVSRIGNGQCAPLPGAIVDVWQCDALGVYSDVRDTAGRFDTRGQKFLRGHQVTDTKGQARFVTIYPGWYEGRTVHIHFKIRTAEGARSYDFTSQLYFDDAFSDRVMKLQPYATKGARSTRNAQDGIFRRSGGEQLMLDVKPKGDGFTSTFAIGLTI